MFNRKNCQEKTAATANACCWILVISVFTVFGPAVLAQQGTAVQPCKTQNVEAQAAVSRLDKTVVTEREIDASIPPDAAVKALIEPYAAKVRALEVVIGDLERDLIKGGIGGGSMGNFVTDAIRTFSSAKLGRPIPLSVLNSGGLRKNSIAAGPLRVNDIFELLPFENALVRIDFTGEQLLKLIGVVVARSDAESGARMKYRIDEGKKPELVSATLVSGQGRELRINPRGTYTVVTIDYLLKLGGGSYAILQKGKNARPLGITLRDAVIEYVKTETAKGRRVRPRLDGRFSNVKARRKDQ